VMLRLDFFTKEIRRLLHGGEKWSQSPVPPWARLAYDACLNAGSTAVVLNLEPPPGVAPNWLPYQGVHRSKCFGGVKTGVPDRLRSGDLLHERQACWLGNRRGQLRSGKSWVLVSRSYNTAGALNATLAADLHARQTACKLARADEKQETRHLCRSVITNAVSAFVFVKVLSDLLAGWLSKDKQERVRGLWQRLQSQWEKDGVEKVVEVRGLAKFDFRRGFWSTAVLPSLFHEMPYNRSASLGACLGVYGLWLKLPFAMHNLPWYPIESRWKY